jgi:hypothetical protein
MRFRTTVFLGGKTATGLVIPDDIVTALGGGKRASVRVSIGGHSYRSTIASMGGRFLVPLSAEHRQAAGVAAGDEVDLELELDTAPREVEVPADLAAALAGQPAARQFFDSLAVSHRKEWARWIEEAKKAETRQARVGKAVSALNDGRRTH